MQYVLEATYKLPTGKSILKNLDTIPQLAAYADQKAKIARLGSHKRSYLHLAAILVTWVNELMSTTPEGTTLNLDDKLLAMIVQALITDQQVTAIIEKEVSDLLIGSHEILACITRTNELRKANN